MSSFAVDNCLGVIRHAGYQRFAVLLGDISDPNFLALNYCLRFSVLVDCLYATLSFTIVHTFLTRLRSGLFPGHCSTEISIFFMNSVATFDQWQGVPSCMKIVRPWMCLCSFSFSLSDSTYLGPFIVVFGGMKHRPPAWHGTPNNLAQWMFHCGYNKFLVKMLTQWLHVVRYKRLHGSFIKKNLCIHSARVQWWWCLAKSSLFFFINGVRCGFCTGLLEFGSNSLLRHLKTVVERIAVLFTCKIAQIFLQES